MALFLVQMAPGGHTTLKNGIDTMVVSADDATDAKAIAKTHLTGDASDAAWQAATVTALADVDVADADALNGWTFRVLVEDPSDNSVVADVTVTGVTTSLDTLDEIGTALATGLNLSAIDNAGYVGATQTLTVATGGGGDDLGDHRVTVEVKPPVVVDANGNQTNDPQHIASFVASVTDEGLSTDALTVVFDADTKIVPTVLAALSST